jgi:hypothetical protein
MGEWVMVRDNVFGFNSPAKQVEAPLPGLFARMLSAVSKQCARAWCGMHGHLILLHFEPNKLSLQCALCGYESEGWDVGRPLAARRKVENRVHSHTVRIERRHALRAVPSSARMAS